MSNSDKKKQTILIGVIAVLLIAAAAVYFMQTRPAAPDAATQAAAERNKQISDGMKSNQPAAPELPVNARPPRGAPTSGK